MGENFGKIFRVGFWVVLVAALVLVLPDPNGRPNHVSIRAVTVEPLSFTLDKNRAELSNAKVYFTDTAIGAEAITSDDHGNFYSANIYGEILLLDFKKNATQVITRTGGRPLALVFDSVSQGIYVADATRGLLWVDIKTNDIKILVTEVDGIPIGTCNNIDITKSGQVYFTDASQWKPNLTPAGTYDTFQAAVLTILSGDPSGRVIHYDPTTKKSRVVASGILYANGIAFSEDESFFVVAECGLGAIRRVYLKGGKAGTWDYLVKGMPVYPDNINRAEDGNFWVASPSSLSPIANLVHPYPLVKSFMFRYLPLAAFPKPPTVAYIMKINAKDGSLMTSIVDSQHATVKSATDVYEKNGMLYISSVKGSFVATFPSPKPK